MEDRRAHERLDEMHIVIAKYGQDLNQHTTDIRRIEKSVEENTTLTRSIETNTAEIVEIMRGAKGIMAVITIMAKLGAAIAVIYGLWHAFVTYLRG